MPEILKQRLILCLIALTTVPFVLVVNMPSWDDISSVALYFSSIFGYIGVALLVWQLMLGTRTISGLFFDDLPDKLKLHHWLGMYGSIAILLHPVLLLVAYSEMIWYLLWPANGGSYEFYVTLGRIAFWGLVVLWTSAVVIRKLLPYRIWRYGHMFAAYPALVLVMLHAPEVGSSFGNSWVQFYWYVFVAVVLICAALRMRHLFGFGKVRYMVSGNDKLSDEVYVMTLQAQEKRLDILPGQYVYLQPSLLRESHPFTILDCDTRSGRVRIAIKTSGRFTKKLLAIRVGQSMLVDGPYGSFLRGQDHGVPTVFVAGGIGVTPFYQQVMEGDVSNTYMFFVNQTTQTAILRKELGPKLGDRYVELFTREEVKQKNVEHGRFSLEILSKYVPNPLNGRYYVCGPTGMIKSTRKLLRQYGIPARNIHVEDFGF